MQPIDNNMPPTNYLAAQGRPAAKTSNETTKLLNATRIQPRWKGKARAVARDLEAQNTPVMDPQLDGPSNSRQKATAERKDAAESGGNGSPASSESAAGPSEEVLPRESPIRYFFFLFSSVFIW